MNTMLKVTDLCYSYPDCDSRRIIYDHADVQFEKGRLYALTGDSSSGKTTFIYVIAGLDKNYEGQVALKDEDINNIGLTKYRRNHVAMIYQNFNLIPYLSPIENIEVALDITDNKVDRRRAAIVRLLDSVEISGKKARLRASVLSGGEQQRVAIARGFW